MYSTINVLQKGDIYYASIDDLVKYIEDGMGEAQFESKSCLINAKELCYVLLRLKIADVENCETCQTENEV